MRPNSYLIGTSVHYELINIIHDIVELFGRSYLKVQTGENCLATQQDTTINATATKSSCQSKQPPTNEARPPVNSFIFTETSLTSRQNTEFHPESSTFRLPLNTLNLVSPYDISLVQDKKEKIEEEEQLLLR
ncbi:hypothetical protein HHI36_003577 [Cryptolaemus montrouzieri]|uniref:Uncharacterized protein n=1 Tax=Cryptolaemus montrouzieri TaxID=559131 RepID=A0ABD2PDY9_9CUCU